MTWEVHLSTDATNWLEKCHPQSDVQRQIQRHFERTFDLLEEYGPKIGPPYVRKIRGFLWEIRVNHNTGAYRLFCGIASDGTIAVACGNVKKSDHFPPSIYEWAENKVKKYLTLLQGKGTKEP